ncbi:MAG: GUN4 domain-containing protein [Cyanobacteriota bacterium]|nr:GUN4 domain-containing protein [Cyanobacteriota bacterium]
MQLSGEQRKHFHKSLLSGFPSKSKLKQMVSFELDENLDEIAMGENYSEIVFELIRWAESHGKVNDLLTAARSSNSGNLDLQSFEEKIQSQFDKNSKSEINVYSSKAKYLYHYKFRAECQHDVDELNKILSPHIKEITKTKDTDFPDMYVEMSVYLSLEEIQAKIKDIEDGHVILETLELKYDYTGERKYLFESTNYPKIEEDDLSSEKGVDYTRLRDLLKAGKWKEADKETLKVMLKAADREKQGWLDSDSIQKFACTDLHTIDRLWVKYSDGHFGFSVQKRIWESVGQNYEKLGYQVGWRGGMWLDKKWLNYNKLTFCETVPQGYLPLEVWIGRGWELWHGWFDDSINGLFLLSRRDL